VNRNFTLFMSQSSSNSIRNPDIRLPLATDGS